MSESSATEPGERTARSDRIPTAVRLARSLLYLSGVVWMALGVIVLRGRGGSWQYLMDDTFRWILFTLMALNAALMVAAGVVLGSGRRIAWYLTLALLAVNIALTFTDQVGIADWGTAVVDVVIVGLLIGSRAWFAAPRQG